VIVYRSKSPAYNNAKHYRGLELHENTEKLHRLMKQHKLNAPQVAAMLGREPNTVRVWRVKDTSRVIPDDTLKLLAVTLAEKRRKRIARKAASGARA
jgi:hypothetical protein